MPKPRHLAIRHFLKQLEIRKLEISKILADKAILPYIFLQNYHTLR